MDVRTSVTTNGPNPIKRRVGRRGVALDGRGRSRFAYFFPPGRDAGLNEVLRVLRRGGALVVIDNDYRNGEFAELLRQSPWAAPRGSADATDEWWRDRGAERVEVMSEWRFDTRADLEQVLRLEFPSAIAGAWLADHPDRVSLTYGYVLFCVRRAG